MIAVSPGLSLVYDRATYNQCVQPAVDESLNCLFGSVHDDLALHIKRGVEDDWYARDLTKAFDKSVIQGI